MNNVLSDLKHGLATFRGVDHLVGFFERTRNRFLDEHVNACFEQSAGNLTVDFSGNGEADGVDVADQLAPVRGPISVSLGTDGARRPFVEIANGNEF